MLPLNPARIPQTYKQALAAQTAGRTDEALALYRQILGVKPGLAEVHFQIGRIAAARGDAKGAEAAFRKALAAKPREVAIWRALAGVLSGGKLKTLRREAAKAGIALDGDDIAPLLQLIAAGRPAEAETRALALTAQAPNAPGPAFALGAARASQGKWAAALDPLRRAVAGEPGNARAGALLGRALLETGRPVASETHLRAALAAGEAVALPLARALSETCRFDAAEAVLAQAARAAPKDARLQAEHGFALAALRRAEPARAACDRAIRAGAREDLRGHMAERLAQEGETGAGMAMLDAALAKRPGAADLLTLRGQMRQSAGDLDGARADLLQAIALDPGGAPAYRAYVAGGKLAEDDPVLAQMQARLADPALPDAARRVLSFAMAKALEDIGRHDQVFAHLHTGNRLMRAAYPYDFNADLTGARNLVDQVSRIGGIAPDTPAADAPVFVSGLPRSGTTLVETILAAHDRVIAAGELPFLVPALAPLSETPPEGVAAALSEAGARYVRAARRRSGAADIFTDKAISTFARVGLAALALPGARFVMLRRDPRDVGLSIYRNMFPEGRHRFSTDLRDIGRYAKLYAALLEHWAAALPDRVHVVDYEALTEEPEPHIRALVAAAGLDWQEACLTPHMARRRVETLSFAQVRQPIYRGAVAGWRRYQDALTPMLEELEKPFSLGAR